MTTVKADIAAADRAMNRACAKAVRLIRAGAHPSEYEPVLVAAEVVAGVLLEPRAARP